MIFRKPTPYNFQQLEMRLNQMNEYFDRYQRATFDDTPQDNEISLEELDEKLNYALTTGKFRTLLKNCQKALNYFQQTARLKGGKLDRAFNKQFKDEFYKAQAIVEKLRMYADNPIDEDNKKRSDLHTKKCVN